MNLLSKILIVVFIIVSVNSISAQDHVSTDGIVKVVHRGYGSGTGFFVSPHTLITNFHVIASIRKSHGNISELKYSKKDLNLIESINRSLN